MNDFYWKLFQVFFIFDSLIIFNMNLPLLFEIVCYFPGSLSLSNYLFFICSNI